MADLKPDQLVSGHGMIGPSAAPDEQRSYLELLLRLVTQAMRRTGEWSEIETMLPAFRAEIRNHEQASKYLINEAALAPGFSLKSHVKRIFQELHKK